MKQRPDHSLELRFVVDLLRSEVNGDTDSPERVMLPRIVDLLERRWGSKDVEFVTPDFSEAGSLVFAVEEG